ncbi:thiopurine S-methyltransferase [Verticiella sediminum]|uniref:Thiopurine S-methyltransferase n=1 Tax=Verticiella sediminum TaxID=1247510 RepID=A0A556B048_9BURK|nr:thiopurine S-methyltransferase [Verticiella sediminum]TSH98125.1 thiopurine S-methyltransferase [Verticiella sediminum]
MEPEFWLSRWREGRTHFHQNRITPPLQKFWPGLGLAPEARVLVPLAGKSLDMLWLAEQGHEVVGVELSELAVGQFFAENGLTPERRRSALGEHWRSGRIELIQGDIFALDADFLAGFDAVYDRAALIALPPDMRRHYVEHVYAGLRSGCRGLLVTLDYPQDEMDGPPFSVPDADVQALYAPHTEASLLDRRDSLAKEPKFLAAGASRLDTLTYRLARR